jgi:hypothetical protein
MAKAGQNKPFGWAAHHIVPARDARFPSGEKCRKILEKFGLGLNEAENGVYLPTTLSDAVTSGSTIHGKVHNEAAYAKVFDAISPSVSKTDLIERLDGVRVKLRNGTF